MRCHNFFCHSHSKDGGWNGYNCNFVDRRIMTSCESRKTYNRIMKPQTSIERGVTLVDERAKYYRRKGR